MKRGICATTCVLAVVMVSGCGIFPSATEPYVYGAGLEKGNVNKLEPGEPQVVRGDPHKFLDWVAHNIVSLPSKLILWNWNVDRHNISPETERTMRQYLADNDLHQVKIRLNDYSPGGEWRRLVGNKAVGPAWRYTLGFMSWLGYTAYPGRFFGGDNYNPYTNTINIYSDHPAIVLHEAGHAKDFAGEEDKGLYAALRLLPIVPLIQESRASSDALGYLVDKKMVDEERDAHKILHPAYGSYLLAGGLFGASYDYIPVEQWVKLTAQGVGIVTGHVVGRTKASKVK